MDHWRQTMVRIGQNSQRGDLRGSLGAYTWRFRFQRVKTLETAMEDGVSWDWIFGVYDETRHLVYTARGEHLTFWGERPSIQTLIAFTQACSQTFLEEYLHHPVGA